MPEPIISIIVCTRDRPEQLLRCVTSIVTATRRAPDCPAEIVVVENESKPSLRLRDDDVVGNQRGVRFISLAQGGLAMARNAGMRAATGQYFVFTDDDCTMEADYIRDLARHIAERPRNVVIGGRVALASNEDLPFTIKDEPEPQDYDVTIHPGGFIQGCNFVVPRQVAKIIGEFDPSYGVGAHFLAGEDTDYFIRARIADIPLQYFPDMGVLHHHGRRTLADIRRLNRSYCYANGALYGKYRRQPWLLKHFYWAIGAAAREFTGGPAFDARLGLTWRSVVSANFAGLFAFGLWSLQQGRRQR